MARSKKVTPEFIERAEQLALRGFSHSQIYKHLNIASSTFYSNAELVSTIRKAEDTLRIDIADDLKTASNNGEISATIFLAKRLGLFATSYKMPQIKSIKTALTQISRINQDLANGTLPSELASALIKNISEFIKAYEVTELAQSIAEIQEQLNDKKKS